MLLNFVRSASLFIVAISILTLSCVLQAKRHSRANKVERFEERAQAAAEANSPLASALSKHTKQMSLEEAVLAREYYRVANQNDMVIKCGERILAVGGDQEIMRYTRLELAELFLNKLFYQSAEKHAKEYLMYYPGSKESKKASFIALDATFRSQKNSYRDQQKTRDTIEQATAFLEKHIGDSEYRITVQNMLKKSYLKLIRSEINIINTQLNAYYHASSPASLHSANRRLAFLKDNYLGHAPEARKKVLDLDLTLAQASKNPELIQKKREELTQLSQGNLSLAVNDSWIDTGWNSLKRFFFEDNNEYFA